MTKADTLAVLSMITAAYPQAFKASDPKQVASVWSEMFDGDDAEDVKKAVKTSICEKPFPPSISDIKAEIKKMHRDDWMNDYIDDRPSAGRAWQAAINAGRCRDAADELGSVSRYAREKGVPWCEEKEAVR